LLAEGRLDFSDPELIFIPKQMTREQLKDGFRRLLRRVFDVDAYFDRVFTGASPAAPRHTDAPENTRNHRRQSLKLKLLGLKPRLLGSAFWARRAVMLASEMARQGLLLPHLRALPAILRKNSSLGASAFGFADMVNLWITYWHFASVTRQISGTQFGIVPETRTAEPPPVEQTVKQASFE
jgi:Domain of unknown function (DUF4070)